MTTEKTKAALDAPETVLKRCAEIFAQHNLVNEAYEIDKYLEALRDQAEVPHGYDDSYTTNATSGTSDVPKTTDAEEITAKIEAEVLAECQFHGVFDAKRIAKDVAPKIAGIFSALRTPAAVPQEVVDILDQIRKSGFVSYDGEKPHVLAVKALALLKGVE